MTFNTLAWQREGRDLEASIAQADPDVVGLQEIGPRAADHLIEAFAERLPYHFVTQSPTSSGAAVLSRYPLRDTVAFRASPQGHWWQRMTIESPAGPITYVNLHTRIPYVRKTHRGLGPLKLPLEFHAERRRNEVRTLVSMLEEIDGPLIVVGDFNMTERSPDHRLLSGRLRDAYQAVGAGLGLSFPRRGAFPIAFPAPGRCCAWTTSGTPSTSSRPGRTVATPATATTTRSWRGSAGPRRPCDPTRVCRWRPQPSNGVTPRALAEFAMATPTMIIAAPASATGVGTSPAIG